MLAYSSEFNKEEKEMSQLSKEQRKGEVTALRSKMKANPCLHVEVLAALIRTFREHGIDIDSAVISDMTIALGNR